LKGNDAVSDDVENVQILPKHTPGPWTIERENDTGPNDEGFWEWFQVGPARVDIPDRESEMRALADALLIAAAPDLLAACRLAVAAMGNMDAARAIQDAIDLATRSHTP